MLLNRFEKKERVTIEELTSGSRRKDVSMVRAHVAIGLVKNYRVTLEEVARRVGVSTPAISKIIQKVYE